MPIRSFRSSAFSPLAPQNVRFIPYAYMAPSVDGPSPVVFSQPLDADNPPPVAVIFSIQAIGEGVLTYQWQMKSPVPESLWVNVTNGGTFSGATTNTLTVNGVVPGTQQTLFRAIVTNDGGSTTSDEAFFLGTI